MKNPMIKTKVVHSQTKAAWNIIGIQAGRKYKIARIPYLVTDHESADLINRLEALYHAEYINCCFCHSDEIFKCLKLKP